MYFTKFWLSNDERIRSWNIHGRDDTYKTLQNRTNNALECYNRYLKTLFKGSHPSLLVFIKTIEKEARHQVQKVEDIKYGKAEAPVRSSANIKTIPEEYYSFNNDI